MQFEWEKTKSYSDFADDVLLEGEKISVDKVLNKQIAILGYRIGNSKVRAGENYMTIQIMLRGEDEPKVVFTGSRVLADQVRKYEGNIPFVGTIRKVKNYYTLT